AVRGGGDLVSTSVRVSLDTGLKVGQFSFSEQDLVIPVNGIPLTVVRTYNSFNTLQVDFAFNWTYAINDMDVVIDEDRELTTAFTTWGADDPTDSTPITFSRRTGGGRNVTLTLPNGQRTTFLYTPTNRATFASAQWTAAPGVFATLQSSDDPTINYFSAPPLQWQKGGDGSTYDNYDIPGFVLTMQDGTIYNLSRDPAAL